MTEDALKQVQIAYSNSLADRSPAIADLVKNIALTGEDVSSFAFEIEGGKDAGDVAKAWVAANSDRVDGWLGLGGGASMSNSDIMSEIKALRARLDKLESMVQ